ncbi:MAG: hypothetical protein HY815_09610 [Candidatus Riflebacteria bacterium]|nr:hypothetical protein [Candidatus Riflebacteria bacterium]
MRNAFLALALVSLSIQILSVSVHYRRTFYLEPLRMAAPVAPSGELLYGQNLIVEQARNVVFAIETTRKALDGKLERSIPDARLAEKVDMSLSRPDGAGEGCRRCHVERDADDVRGFAQFKALLGCDTGFSSPERETFISHLEGLVGKPGLLELAEPWWWGTPSGRLLSSPGRGGGRSSLRLRGAGLLPGRPRGCLGQLVRLQGWRDAITRTSSWHAPVATFREQSYPARGKGFTPPHVPFRRGSSQT